jgi:gluconate 5-dehydrogenase
MKEQGGGNIINISSVMAFPRLPGRGPSGVPYNSTKAAINLLTMNLAVKLAPYNIRVNAIAPGFFHTDMMAYIDKPEFQAIRQAIVNEIPLRRVGEIDDMKGAAVFLASPASQFITGHVMVVDGGQIAK